MKTKFILFSVYRLSEINSNHMMFELIKSNNDDFEKSKLKWLNIMPQTIKVGEQGSYRKIMDHSDFYICFSNKEKTPLFCKNPKSKCRQTRINDKKFLLIFNFSQSPVELLNSKSSNEILELYGFELENGKFKHLLKSFSEGKYDSQIEVLKKLMYLKEERVK